MAWTTILKAGAAALCAIALAAPASQAQRRGASRVTGCAPMSRPGLLAASGPDRIAFDGGSERVMLSPACGGSLAERVRGGQGKRFILLVDDLRARRASGVVFSLHLSKPSDGEKTEDGPVLGRLNFFAARPLEAPGSQRRMSYDVTNTVRGLAQSGQLDRGLVVMLRPSEPPAPGSELSIARLQLVEQ